MPTTIIFSSEQPRISLPSNILTKKKSLNKKYFYLLRLSLKTILEGHGFRGDFDEKIRIM